MEVHHHPIAIGSHTSRKNWTHYFWEFLMLFLAVFCGFMAENFREHKVEHFREKQFMYSLLEDLERDIADLKADIPFWDRQFRRIDSIRQEINLPASNRNPIAFYQLVSYMRDYNKFLYHDRTISQFKNGGNFRLIRKEWISDSLIEYDAMISSTLRDMEAHSNTLWHQMNFLQNRIFNSHYFAFPFDPVKPNLDSIAKANRHLIEPKEGTDKELFEYSNQLEYFKSVNRARNFVNNILLRQSTNLIGIIKKEYHLK